MDINQIITDKIISILERGTTKQGKRWTPGFDTKLRISPIFEFRGQ